MGTYIDDLLPAVRRAMAVGSSADDDLVAGLRRNASHLLRNYNFPESITYYASATLADASSEISLPAGVGKIRGVRLKLASESPALYKLLRRREESVLPTEGGPMYWRRVGLKLQFDTTLEIDVGDDYRLELWYQTVDATTAESWLTDSYADALLHRSMFEMAPMFRKPEAQQVYAPLWQESQAVLAVYLNELEFENLDLRMGNDEPVVLHERYPA